MRKRLGFLAVLSLAFVVGFSACGKGISEEDLKRDFDLLIQSCLSNDLNAAAPYLIYRGRTDKARGFQDSLNMSNPDEQEMAKKGCAELLERLGDNGSYTFTSISKKRASEGVWYAAFAKIEKNKKPGDRVFAFLKLKDKFVLGDID